jgi:hypothetical protein
LGQRLYVSHVGHEAPAMGAQLDLRSQYLDDRLVIAEPLRSRQALQYDAEKQERIHWPDCNDNGGEMHSGPVLGPLFPTANSMAMGLNCVGIYNSDG